MSKMGTCFDPKYILYTHTGIVFTYPLINDGEVDILTWKEYDKALETIDEYGPIYDYFNTRMYISKECGLTITYYGKDWNEFYDEYEIDIPFDEIDKQRKLLRV